MKRSRCDEVQIFDIFAVAGGHARGRFVSQAVYFRRTLYKWGTKYGGMDVSNAMRLRQLEKESALLRKMAADQSWDIHPQESSARNF